MAERIIQQYGEKSIYIEKQNGDIYMGEYVEEAVSAFRDGSFELYEYAPKIKPSIPRSEVGQIKEWIEKEASTEKTSRLALLYGKAGIGKSVVMHDLLVELQANHEYQLLGLKSDQVEFVDTDDLGKKLHLAKPIEVVIGELAQQYKRVVLLIDQIDALSLSLSSNRTPLRSLLKLISRVIIIPHVRVVISCRPYDLEYDPLLDQLQVKHKWELKELPKEKVEEILKENHIDEHLSDRLLRFLGNPLHLYLYLKVDYRQEQMTDPLSTDLLYHQLWSKYIADDSERKVDKDRLLALLDTLVTAMYERQELSVHIRAFETEYIVELRYLFTCGWLLLTKSNQIQFFHQTLFDYVYARRFTEKGNNLLDDLKGQHQGLFSRAAVKSILTFLREKNAKQYINTIEELLFAKKEDGEDTYRYHLKSLALSNMVYFEMPLKEEIGLIERRVYAEKSYIDVIFETVHTAGWFHAVWDIIKKKGGWKAQPTTYKEKVMLMCQRTLWPDARVVLDEVERSLDYKKEEDCQYIGKLLQTFELNENGDKLIGFYNKLVKNRCPLEYIHLLRNILKTNPDFVCEEFKENARLQLAKKEKSGFHTLSYNHEEESLFEELLKRNREKGIQLLVDILTLVYEATKYEIEGSEIYNSYEFFSFQRARGGHFESNFSEDAVNIIIDYLLQNVNSERPKQYLKVFSQSKHEGFVYIALQLYTAHPELFKEDAYVILKNRRILSNAPSWVEYQAIEALKTNYPLWTDEQKKNIIEIANRLEDRGERKLYGKENIEMRLQWGHPILDIDLHKGKALYVLPDDDLRRLSWEAYQEKERIKRKFKKQRLENDLPSKSSMHSGWTSLTKEQGHKMSCKTWFKSMLKYTTNPIAWDKPSLTGQCQLFRIVVQENPDKYLGLIDEAIACDKIQIAYPVAGMQGLIDAGRINEAEHVLNGILDVIGHNLNTDVRGFSIHSLLFAVGDWVKSGNVTDDLFHFLCDALKYSAEPEEDRHKEDKDVYNVGINQARGNAGYMLVECAKDERFGKEIFDTIESVAETASVYTRAAILLNMAALNFIDKNRNVDLFKKLMHDYDARLMSMPVHNYNPLVYFVNYAVKELMDFFQHAAKCPECYKEQVIILWLAWMRNKQDKRLKALLDSMCDSSEEARISLLQFLYRLDEKVNDDAIVYILRFMEPQFNTPEMGSTFDHLFHNLDKWPDEMQKRITEAYVNSPVSKHQIRAFVEYLAGYAIKEPVQTLEWLEKVLEGNTPEDYFIWNQIVDVIIQSYNGIKSFNDSGYQDTLEHAMDLIDSTMKNPNNKYLISNFMNKLDNE